MKVYHGTSEAVARAALEDGLLPREATASKGNWEDCPSNSELVYVTVGYAGYFAMHASDDGKWGIVEIETDLLDEECMLPDEDFMEQATRNQWDELRTMTDEHGFDPFPADGDMQERTLWFREHIKMFAHVWEESIRLMGNAAHDGAIVPDAITRVSIFEPRANFYVAHACGDPTISILNYQILGAKYEAITAWLMGDQTTRAAEVIAGWSSEDISRASKDHAKLAELWAQSLDGARHALADTSGLEILPGMAADWTQECLAD